MWRTVFKRPTVPPPPTESRMGWESHPPAPASQGVTLAKLAMVGVPLVAGVAIAIWWLAGGGSTNAPVAEVAALPPVQPALAAAPTPVPDPSVPDPSGTVEADATAPTPSPGPATTRGNSHTREPGSHESSRHSSRRASTAKIAEPADPAGAPAAPGPAAPTPGTAPPVPAASSAPVTPAPPAAAPVPPASPPPPVPPVSPVIDAPPPQLSHAMVDRVAAAHRRELSKCDGGEELHGEITVRFVLDAGGKAVNAQVATSLGKPRVAACILHVVQGWHFDGQAAGAQGTYTLSFQ
jgi:hypothetical protein